LTDIILETCPECNLKVLTHSSSRHRRRSDWNPGGRMAGLTMKVLL